MRSPRPLDVGVVRTTWHRWGICNDNDNDGENDEQSAR